MKNTIPAQLKYCLFVCLLLIGVLRAKAQYVTIPDTVFVNWLKNNGYSACLTGNQLDTTCGPVVNANKITCYGKPIKDLTGIQYFRNLTSLDCSNDSLYNIPALPGHLTYLDCEANNLNTLPILPGTLHILICLANHLTSLPSLPDSLRQLVCFSNSITSLPALPPYLDTLYCSENKITVIPTLPSNLVYFNCTDNLVTTLPALPPTLIYLGCHDNSISTIPTLPNFLQSLDCASNRISALPPLPQTLQYLGCDGNSPFAALPSLPAGLKQLYCGTIQLSLIPQLPDSLLELECHRNSLTSLPNLPSHLNYLDCAGNQLTALPDLPPGLSNLYCFTNLISSLPPLPDSLNDFYCNDNPNLSCLPEIKIVNTLNFSSTAITCLPDYGTVHNSTPALDTVPLCGIFNPTGCGVFWDISGRTYYDANSNCAFDSSDVATPGVKAMLDSAGVLIQQVYSGGEGFYSFKTNYGAYKLSVDTTDLPFTLRCPALDQLTPVISANDSLSYSNDFAFQCRTVGFDLGVHSIWNSNHELRPGAGFILKTYAGDMAQLYGAHCATGISGKVIITFNGPVTFKGSAFGSLIPLVSGDSLIYTIADFGNINNSIAFNTGFVVTDSAVPGNIICFSVSVTPTTGDFNLSNNTATYCFPVVDALDPNEKEVYPTYIDSANQWLTYTVRFQNTGTATAVNIIVKDTLSANLDPASFELLASSAKNLTQIFGNVVVFNFPNINLPDSTTSDSLSRGFVQYRIKTIKNLKQHSVTSNRASIYFDLNTPVVTNTVTDTMAAPAGCVPNDTSLTQTICSGDSVLFNNIYYHISGTYTDTLTNAGGCDSVVNLALTVLNPISTQLNDTICASDSLLFNGIYYHQTGTNNAHYTSTSGCDSAVTLNLLVYPVFNNSNSISIACGDSASLNGIFYYSPGTYSTTLSTVNGCDSIITLVLSVTADTTNLRDTICSNDSLLFNGIYYHTSGTHSQTLSTLAGCDSIVNLTLKVLAPISTQLNDIICSSDSLLFNGIYYNQPGSYNAHFTSANGCDSLVTLTLTVTPIDTVSLQHVLCDGDSLYFYGTWLTAGGTYDTLLTSGCDTLVTLTITTGYTRHDSISARICGGNTYYVGDSAYTQSGLYTSYIQLPGGCDSVVKLLLLVTPLVNVSLSWDSMVMLNRFMPYYPGDTLLCSNAPVSFPLAGGLPAGGTYSGLYVVNDSLQYTGSTTGPDTIYYSVTDSFACTYTAWDIVYINACTGIQNIQTTDAISIYPNPANNLLYIKAEGLHAENILIYDVDGQLVAKQVFAPEIDIHNLTAGVYLLEVVSQEGVARKRWVKM